jgi:hypothetical protein
MIHRQDAKGAKEGFSLGKKSQRKHLSVINKHYELPTKNSTLSIYDVRKVFLMFFVYGFSVRNQCLSWCLGVLAVKIRVFLPV